MHGQEPNKYDWVSGSRWKALIYTGRKRHPKGYTDILKMSSGTALDPLCLLLKEGLLKGQALEDALGVCPISLL